MNVLLRKYKEKLENNVGNKEIIVNMSSQSVNCIEKEREEGFG